MKEKCECARRALCVSQYESQEQLEVRLKTHLQSENKTKTLPVLYDCDRNGDEKGGGGAHHNHEIIMYEHSTFSVSFCVLVDSKFECTCIMLMYILQQ